ncbi:hypothetical protein H1S01_04080 [Heliobacterium chlorum]|uniref:4-vinyl reductase 4VR domain-containing protein n=1 Tax=Heliobacterium chlorum TaxID=2698 RepID=A0ABR7SYS6_HELCL|nr:hypothetical protein [Heliobacterium chlorum]MBC9783689.1 hypothetical protein [Heliobacterium chlorum]
MPIDRKQIIDHLCRLEVEGNENGMISAFGVFLTQLPADFWNNFAERLTRSVRMDLRRAAEELLINAAHECGYHTGQGILSSEEWRSVVQPFVFKPPEDTLHGLLAVITSWGWAKAEIVELIPKTKMVVRSYDYYEADIVEQGRSSKMSAYMLCGICAAFMDLVYGDKYPNGIHTFQCAQTKGIECGDEYGEFVAVKSGD